MKKINILLQFPPSDWWCCGLWDINVLIIFTWHCILFKLCFAIISVDVDDNSSVPTVDVDDNSSVPTVDVDDNSSISSITSVRQTNLD